MSENSALYLVSDNSLIPPQRGKLPDKSGMLDSFVVSTPFSLRICNDPLVTGFDYTSSLKEAVKIAFRLLREKNLFTLREKNTIVLNLLRGGLNFGIREALAEECDWNFHSSAFLSAQRERLEDDPENWKITETSYQKIYLKKESDIVFGDVVATGTSLGYALEYLENKIISEDISPGSLYFITIGGPESIKRIEKFKSNLLSKGKSFNEYKVIFIEGIFSVPDPETPLTIKLTGTDLLRRDALLAPEFKESQKENPSYPLERCTIYDAGSRAFDLATYLLDVESYWKEVLCLAGKGTTYKDYFLERFPEGELSKSDISLEDLCNRQLNKVPQLPPSIGAPLEE